MNEHDAITALEKSVLSALKSEWESEVMFGFCFCTIQHIADKIGVSRAYARVALRSLTDQGKAKYARGLFTESGEVFGAGYAAVGEQL